MKSDEKLVVSQLPLRFEQLQERQEMLQKYGLYPFKIDLRESLSLYPDSIYVDSQMSDGDDDDYYYSLMDGILSKLLESKDLIYSMKQSQPTLNEYNVIFYNDKDILSVQAYHTLYLYAKTIRDAKNKAVSTLKLYTSLPDIYALKSNLEDRDIYVESSSGISIENVLPLDNDFFDEEEAKRLKEEKDRVQKQKQAIEKRKFLAQKVKYKKSKDFWMDGIWITTIDGTEYDIFRDATSGISNYPVWYGGDRTDKALNMSFEVSKILGYTKKEATQKLLELIWQNMTSVDEQ